MVAKDWMVWTGAAGPEAAGRAARAGAGPVALRQVARGWAEEGWGWGEATAALQGGQGHTCVGAGRRRGEEKGTRGMAVGDRTPPATPCRQG